jgi:bacillithiol biosynthesis deacetylase BshB1
MFGLNNMHVDVLAIGAHPDDLELSCGGTLLRLHWQGYRVGLVDMTRGERGTRGTSDIRAAEAEAAWKILGSDFRENLDLGDMTVCDSPENRVAVVECIRRHKPSIVITHAPQDRHPDHEGTSALVKHAMFFSGARNFPARGEPHVPTRMLYFPSHWVQDMNVYVDVTPFWEQKILAAKCYTSQFFDPNSSEPSTLLSRPNFFEDLEARCRHFGLQCGVKYAEGFWVREKMRVDDLVNFFVPK